MSRKYLAAHPNYSCPCRGFLTYCVNCQDLRLIKDNTKKGSFKPFDRSFLLKRRRCGRDLFKDKALSITQVDDDELKELFTANGPLIGTGEYIFRNAFNISVLRC